MDIRNEYIDLQNMKYSHKLNDLINVQKELANKTRLIELNEDQYQEKEFWYYIFIIFFTLFLLFIFPLVAYLGNLINSTYFYSIFLLFMISFIILFLYLYYFNIDKTHAKPTLSSLPKSTDNFYHRKRGQLDHNIDNFLKKDCNCDNDNINPINLQKPTNTPNNPNNEPLPITNNPNISENNGFYYYDGSAPKQRFIPKSTEKDGFRIIWETAPDFGSRKDNRYTPEPTWMPNTIGLAKGRLNKSKCVNLENFSSSNTSEINNSDYSNCCSKYIRDKSRKHTILSSWTANL